MRVLYDGMQEWQHVNSKRLLSVSIQQDGGNYCCIALTNPTEVVLMNGSSLHSATVTSGGKAESRFIMSRILHIYHSPYRSGHTSWPGDCG